MASFADYVKDVMSVLPKVNGNPMLSVTSMTDDNARYRENPLYKSRDIQARDQLVLDEEERKRREADQFKSGMMSGGVGGSEDTGQNYWGEREAELGKTMSKEAVQAQILAEQVHARQQVPMQLLELLTPGLTAIKGIQSLFSPPVQSYATPWDQMTPQEKAYHVNNQAPVTDSMVSDAAIADAIANSQAAQALEAQGIGIGAFGGSGSVGAGGGNAAAGFNYGGW